PAAGRACAGGLGDTRRNVSPRTFCYFSVTKSKASAHDGNSALTMPGAQSAKTQSISDQQKEQKDQQSTKKEYRRKES
ncbi:MAG: hypothetical protein IKP40_06910, partial [Clostridia bacterium]|nr:hypothetical protein [Clostridia bacterium]